MAQQQAIKYRGIEADHVWSGRGRKPQWVLDYVLNGHSLDDICVGVGESEEKVIETITYEEFTARVRAADVTVHCCDMEEGGGALVCLSIEGDGIEFSVEVWMERNWNQGRFYDIQESYVQQCPTVIDNDGEVVIEAVRNSHRSVYYNNSDVIDLVRDKINHVSTKWHMENMNDD